MNPRSLNFLTQNYQGPAYVYDTEILKARAAELKSHLPQFQIHYAVKANFHPQLLNILKQQGLKVDTVSAGEINRALESGFLPEDVIYSGVGKTVREIDRALDLDIYQLNIESPSELKRVQERAAAKNKVAAIAFRINPDVDIKTHPYIATGLSENKFGIAQADLPALYEEVKRSPNVSLKGLTMHLGSQMTDLGGFKEGLQKLRRLFLEAQSFFPSLDRFDIGGGIGIFYEDEDLSREKTLIANYGEAIKQELKGMNAHYQTEPGRWIAARVGGLMAQVQYIKHNGVKKFAILDSGMNHLMRPTLYSAFHRVLPLKIRPGNKEKYDIVGPICESSDFFAKNREMTPLEEGDFVWIADSGAYGSVMASAYNLHPFPQEIFL
ncbi:MAG: diaminopimelate decarboxylase [Bdellovibrionota bacterium]